MTPSFRLTILCSLCFLALLLSAMPAQGQYKIPSGPDAFSDVQYAPMRVAFFRRMFVEPYLNTGLRDEKWDAKAIETLEHFALYEATAPDAKLGSDIWVMQKKAKSLGCNDGLIRSMFHPFTRQYETRYVGGQTWEQYHELMEKTDYPHYTRMRVAAWALETAHIEENEEAQKKYQQMVIHHFYECAKHEVKDVELRLLYDFFSRHFEKQYLGELDALDQDIRKYIDDREIDRWLLYVMRGEVQIKLAWKSRGNGWAHSVTEEGWRGFREHLKNASTYLRMAHQLRPRFPEAATLMIKVMGGGHHVPGEDETFWFNKAMAAQMDWLPAYRTLMVFTLPRWGGSHYEILRIGQAGLNTNRFDTNAPMAYCHAVSTIYHDDEESARMMGLVEGLNRVFHGYENEPRWKARKRWYQSAHLAYMWRFRSYKDGRDILIRTKGRFVDEALLTFNLTGAFLRDEMVARGGPAGETIDVGDQLLADGHFDRAAACYRAGLQLDGEEPMAKRFFEARLKSVEQMRTMATGEWVDLTFDKQLTGWKIVYGKFKRKNSKTVALRPIPHGLTAYLDMPVGPRYEFECVIQTPDQKLVGSPAILLGGVKSPSHASNFKISFWQNDEGEYIHIARNLGGFRVNVDAMHPVENKARLVVWDRDMAIYVNDELVYNCMWREKHIPFGKNEWFGIGTYAGGWAGKDILFSNLRLRKLTERPELFGPEPVDEKLPGDAHQDGEDAEPDMSDDFDNLIAQSAR